jgi:hypothetical protein
MAAAGGYQFQKRDRLHFSVDPQFELVHLEVWNETSVPVENHHVRLTQPDVDMDRMIGFLLLTLLRCYCPGIVRRCGWN